MSASDSDSADRETRLVCRYESNLSPITLKAAQVYKTSLFELEDLWEDCLYESSKLDKPSLYYMPRMDAAWLSCVKPHTLPLDSVLGILEEIVARDEDDAYATIIKCYGGCYDNLANGDAASATVPHKCTCPYPHENWKRQEWHAKDESTQTDRTLNMDLIDLRACTGSDNQLFLPTPASCVHFFRSILNCAHSKSPWVVQDKPDRRHAVMLLLNQPSANLIDFRVSDACPSWYLHSVATVQLAADQVPWNTHEQEESTNLTISTLLVYRQLAPRAKLSLKFPPTGALAPAGCLWETFVVQDTGNAENSVDTNGSDPVPSTPQLQYRLVAPPYIDGPIEYPHLSLDSFLTRDNLACMIKEADSIQHWTAWPESQHYSNDPDKPASWNVFPLCHCFPANKVENKKWIEMTCYQVPQTVKLLKQYLGDTLRTALFSRLDAESTLEAHTGWNDLANHVYRMHIPLVVPDGHLCGVWVDGCVETHRVGEAFLLDDSKIHRAFNYSLENRIVLILDLERPSSLPLGTATGGHSEELDKFIEQMGQTRIEL
jgi:Aspartyl/Asparaginyl beta-hydroxylase